jgi:hypothetical protein
MIVFEPFIAFPFLSLAKFELRALSSAKIDRWWTYIAASPQWTLKSGK